jgi:hypothetical protein
MTMPKAAMDEHRKPARLVRKIRASRQGADIRPKADPSLGEQLPDNSFWSRSVVADRPHPRRTLFKAFSLGGHP